MNAGFRREEERRLSAESRNLVQKWQRDAMAPSFDALADCIEARLHRAAALLAEPSPGAEESYAHRRLRLALTITLVERYRRTLWMSAVLWTDMAGGPPMGPLSRIDASGS